MKTFKNYLFPLSMLLALIIGTILGLFANDEFVSFISPFGDIFVNLMFTLVVPLVFFTITSSISNLNKKEKLSKILVGTIIVFVITSLISSLFAVLGVSLFKPTADIVIPSNDDPVSSTSFLQALAEAITVPDFFNLLSKSHMLALIIFSVIFGLCLRSIDKEQKVSKSLSIISETILKFVKVIMYYAPIGVCAYFATLVKSLGGEVLTSYLRTFIIYIALAILYFLIFYTLYSFIAGGKDGIKKFYRNIFPSVVTSLATQSSLASLPTNIEVSDKMNINKNISSVSLPLASTIHMEGSAIGAIIKIFFLLNIYGLESSSLEAILFAVLIAILSSVVMSGIPGGGLIGEMLIVSLYNLPAGAFAIIATIGWLIDAPATMLNVCGDIPSTMLAEKFIYRNKKIEKNKNNY